MNKFISIICLSVAIAASLPGLIEADVIDVPPSPKVQYMLLANSIATQYGVKIATIKAIINCESSWDVEAHNVTSRENSYGLVQINRLAHPDITIAQAKDPEFAITYLAKNIQKDPSKWKVCSKIAKRIA